MSDLDRLNDDSRTSGWARLIMPILVRQARSRQPITYGAVAREVGMPHHRPVQRAAGQLARALIEIGALRGWRRRPPPPLQALIINKETGLPGHGVDGFMSRRYRQASTKAQREAALLIAHGAIYAYPHWDDVLRLLDLDPDTGDLQKVTDKATETRDRGGEGPEHKALKEYVAANPRLVGLAASHSLGSVERRLPSGDQVDVVFAAINHVLAIEVKSTISADDDVARGVYCLART